MINTKRRRLARVVGTAALACLLPAAGAAAMDDWPARPLRLIVPFAPGSTPDLVARLVGERLSARLSKPVIVENRPGAGGNIGTDLVAKSAPDGYTFGLTISGPLAANTLLYKKLPYDPQRDLDLVTIAATQPSVLVVALNAGIDGMPALLSALRKNPGRYNFASMGTGSISHLAMAALAARSGTEIVHVPYTGSGQAVSSLLTGDTQIAVLPAAAVMPQVRAGKLKALAVATARRSGLLPHLPTLQESGLQDVQGDAWMGFILPARTPLDIGKRLNNAIVEIMHAPDMKHKLAIQYMEPVGGTASEFRDTVRDDLARWQPVIARHHLSME
ncbi:MAG: Tripartite tricarboxylate transporter family receptor [Herminiimonas sp.]|nr:Tripartite tricarboxylate transporter family receptor [Herminiimonas sp.]